MYEQVDFFFACLEMHILDSNDPMIALRDTIEDYAFVYMDIDPYTGCKREYDWPKLLRGL